MYVHVVDQKSTVNFFQTAVKIQTAIQKLAHFLFKEIEENKKKDGDSYIDLFKQFDIPFRCIFIWLILQEE